MLSSTISSPSNDSKIPEGQVGKLRRWFFVYLGCWLGGIVFLFIGGEAAVYVGLFLFFGSLVPYIISMVYAYKVQASLKNAGLIRSGAWHIVVAALIITPFTFGFYVPLSVLLAVRRIRIKLALNEAQ
jgi:ABC-type enterochelin transport system permease subunit